MSAVWALLAVAASATGMALLVPTAPSPVRSSDGPRDALGDRPAREVPLVRVAATLAVVSVCLFFVGLPVGAGIGVAAGVGCWWAMGRLEPPAQRRRREALAAAVPHAVDLLAACLVVGHSPDGAVEQITPAVDPPLRQELAAISARLRLGVDPVTVWRDLADHPQLGGLGRTVARATESGASVADAMLRLADDLRRRNRSETETRARSVGVKAALPLGGCLLPAFVLIGVVPLVAGSVTVLLHR